MKELIIPPHAYFNSIGKMRILTFHAYICRFKYCNVLYRLLKVIVSLFCVSLHLLSLPYFSSFSFFLFPLHSSSPWIDFHWSNINISWAQHRSNAYRAQQCILVRIPLMLHFFTDNG